MRYFVTGATGFVGSELVRQLVRAGHQVRALVRQPERSGALRELGVTSFAGDVTERDSMREAMRGVDGVFHVAAWYKIGARDRHLAQRTNVDGTRNVVDLARELGVPKTVYTSTLAVFGDTRGKLVDESYRHDGPFLSEYDRTKWEAHYLVAEPVMREGGSLVIVQPGVVYGPGDAGPMRPLWLRYLRGRLPVVPGGTAYCWGHVEDTARGHVLAMERGTVGESYIIAGPAHTLMDAFAIGARITGFRAPRAAPPALFKIGARVLDLLGQDGEPLRVIAGTTYLGDDAKARREIGFEARPLETGLRETLRYEMRMLEGSA